MITPAGLAMVEIFDELCGPERAENVRVLLDLGMIEAFVDREDLPVRWLVTAKGRRALEAACDQERAL